MTYHSNAKATIELLDSWGHGRARSGDWTARPATLICDDGDGHYDAWAFTGDKREAALLIANVTRFTGADEPRLVIIEGNSIEAIGRDQWAEGVETVERDDDGEPMQYHYNPAAHPGGLVMT